jgi:peroxiredoxin Q/BCP
VEKQQKFLIKKEDQLYCIFTQGILQVVALLRDWGFSAKFDEFTAVNTVIYGVSMDSMESHEEFKKEFDFPFELILDGDGKLCEEYGVLKPKNKDGLDYKGIARTTFLIDSGGEVVHQWDEVDVKNHAEDVLNVIKDLNK